MNDRLCCLAAALLAACSDPGAAPRPTPALEVVEPTAPVGDATRGRELMAEFECNRCHDGTGLVDEPEERHCVACHQSIRAGTFEASAAHLRRWRRNLVSLNDVPSLANLGGHLRRDWVEAYLLDPHDVRPGLLATMPRLPLSEEQARDIAAALVDTEPTDTVTETTEQEPGGSDTAPGLALLTERGCMRCHAFSGALDAAPVDADAAAQTLAPDLRHTRARMSRAALERWLRAPEEQRPGTAMPTPALTGAERSQVADAILATPLGAPAATAVPSRLPLLERPVRFAEVEERVLARTCKHCHADADFAQGEAGAGNTGGFGFGARGVNLLDYAGISSGYIADDGERRSLFASDDGTPHLVRVLMARHSEQAGQPVADVVGMPLGLPAVSMQDVQLVESWIAQGRPN